MKNTLHLFPIFIALLCYTSICAANGSTLDNKICHDSIPTSRKSYDEYEKAKFSYKKNRVTYEEAEIARNKADEARAAAVDKSNAASNENKILIEKLKNKDTQLTKTKRNYENLKAKQAKTQSEKAALAAALKEQEEEEKQLIVELNELKASSQLAEKLAAFYAEELSKQNEEVRRINADLHEKAEQLKMAEIRIMEYENLHRTFKNVQVYIQATPCRRTNSSVKTQNKWELTRVEFEIKPIGSTPIPSGLFYLEILQKDGTNVPHNELNQIYTNANETFQKQFRYKGGMISVFFPVFGARQDGTLSGEKFYARITFVDESIEPVIEYHVTNFEFDVRVK